jgi:hypothetical protein
MNLPPLHIVTHALCQYAFMAWRLIKHKDNLIDIMEIKPYLQHSSFNGALTPTSDAVVLNGTNSNHFCIAATIPGERNRTNVKKCKKCCLEFCVLSRTMRVSMANIEEYPCEYWLRALLIAGLVVGKAWVKMGNADTKLNFRKAVVQLTTKTHVSCWLY